MAGIYLHIPFCKQACSYCNFHFSTSLQLKDQLLQALVLEMALQKSYLGTLPIETLYIGGGSPSLLSSEELLRLFAAIEKYFPHQDLKEVTLEANPDDLSVKYLKELKNTPINRLSIGIQSFREQDLRLMNRAHTAEEADYALKAAQDAGFDNLSIDLIYGTPGLTNETWVEHIRKVVGLGIPHLSSYALTVEPKTALAHQIAKGKTPAPSNRQAAEQMMLLIQTLNEAQFDHYEISNFALPGRHALHNTNYWKSIPYLGLGPSAHSYNGHSRQWNVAHNPQYINSLLSAKTLAFEYEVLSEKDQLNEYLMTSLRTMWGCDLAYIQKKFGSETAQEIRKKAEVPIRQGTLVEQKNHLMLTTSGKLRADAIAADFFSI